VPLEPSPSVSIAVSAVSIDLTAIFINLGFITEGRLAAVLITPSLGVPNRSVTYINTAPSHLFIKNTKKLVPL
jgi:hypothetical protein